MTDALQRKLRNAIKMAENGHWDEAIKDAGQLPKNWNVWEQLAATEVPPQYLEKFLKAIPKSEKHSVAFALATNPHEDWSHEQLDNIFNMSPEDYYVTNRIEGHRNFDRLNSQEVGAKKASDFWASYERKVQPQHFAAVKSMFTGKPETVATHRDGIGTSHGDAIIENGHLYPMKMHPLKDDEKENFKEKFSSEGNKFKAEDAIPHLKDHAKKVQDAILNDENIEKKYINGIPHIHLHRGVSGEYAQNIRNAAGYSSAPGGTVIENKKLKIPTAHLTSWTVDRPMAQRFAKWRAERVGAGPMTISSWIPVKEVLHSGFHHTHTTQEHAHPQEQEIVVGHPEGSHVAETKHMEFGPNRKMKPTDNAYFHKPKLISKKAKEALSVTPKLKKSDFHQSEETAPLLNRIEDKYLVKRKHMIRLTSALKEKLKQGDSDTDVRFNKNQTIYMDNLDMDAFRDSLDGIRPRFKLRIRRYSPNNKGFEKTAFVEMKLKTEDGVTKKTRIRISSDEIDSVAAGKTIKIADELVNLNNDISRNELGKRVAAINTIIYKCGFEKQLVVEYNRRAYSNTKIRVTVDENLVYFDAKKINKSAIKFIEDSDAWKENNKIYDKVKEKDYVIVEVKHHDNIPGWVEDLLEEVNARKVKFSKYSAGVASFIKDGMRDSGSITRPKKMDAEELEGIVEGNESLKKSTAGISNSGATGVSAISEIESLEKALPPPIKHGERSPDNRYVADWHHGKKLAWFNNKEIAAAHDAEINKLLPSFIQKLPTEHQAVFQDFANGIKNSRFRHSVPAKDIQTGEDVPRARHLKGILKGEENFDLKIHNPNQLTLTAFERHGDKTRPSTFNYAKVSPEKADKANIGGDYVKPMDRARKSSSRSGSPDQAVRRGISNSEHLSNESRSIFSILNDVRPHGRGRVGAGSGRTAESVQSGEIKNDKTNTPGSSQVPIRKSILDRPGSNKLSTQKSLFGTLRGISSGILTKAFKSKDLTRLSKKHTTSGANIVDESAHLAQHPAPEGFKAIANDPKEIKGIDPANYGGISPKMIHHDPMTNTTYMSKPYHKSIESHTRSWVNKPIQGWATMATKNLFHAAGLGHAVEDVSTHIHNGLPLVVSSFAKTPKHAIGPDEYEPYKPAAKNWSMERAESTPDLRGMVTLDFLTNNLDRHGGNLMHAKNQVTGNSHLVAIDHERNFQYNKGSKWRYDPIMPGESHNSDVLFKYGEAPGYSVLRTQTQSPYDLDEYADWWDKNKHNIKNSLYGDLNSIKDPNIKNHIKNNFDARWNHIEEFSQNRKKGVEGNPFQRSYAKTVPMIKAPSGPKLTVKALSQQIPTENTAEAVSGVLGLGRKARSANQQQYLQGIFKEKLKHLPAEEWVNFLSSKVRHLQQLKPGDSWQGDYYESLKSLEENKDPAIIKQVVDRIGDNMLPYWKDRLLAAASKK